MGVTFGGIAKVLLCFTAPLAIAQEDSIARKFTLQTKAYYCASNAQKCTQKPFPKDWTASETKLMKELFEGFGENIPNYLKTIIEMGHTNIYRVTADGDYFAFCDPDVGGNPPRWTEGYRACYLTDLLFETLEDKKLRQYLGKQNPVGITLLHELSHLRGGFSDEFNTMWKNRPPQSEWAEAYKKYLEIGEQQGLAASLQFSRDYAQSIGFPSLYGLLNSGEALAELVTWSYHYPDQTEYLPSDVHRWLFEELLK